MRRFWHWPKDYQDNNLIEIKDQAQRLAIILITGFLLDLI